MTDIDGEIFQHLEYFPFGETWVEESSNTQRTPYLFTGKELDEETGLYYFGARYYDPRTSVWQSPDPAVGVYLSGRGSGDGVYSPRNLSVFAYSHNRPVIAKDPDGRLVLIVRGTDTSYDDPRYQSGSDFVSAIQNTTGEPVVIVGAIAQFTMGNNDADRHSMAQRMADVIRNHPFADGEELTIIAHSHGNNATKIYSQSEDARQIDTWVQLNAPHTNDQSTHQYEANYSIVDRVISVWTEYDAVVPNAGGSDGSSANILRYGPADYQDDSSPSDRTTNIEFKPAWVQRMLDAGVHPRDVPTGKTLAAHSEAVSGAFWNQYIAPEW